MKVKKFRVGDITLYRVASTFYVNIHPEAPYQSPGVTFTIVAPPTKSAGPPRNLWRRERWKSVVVKVSDGEQGVEIRLVETVPLTVEQIAFFQQYK